MEETLDLESLDLEAMKALLIAQHERYTRTLSSRVGEIERLMLLVAKLNQMLFGRKSEKVLRQIEQLEFQLEDLQAASAVEETQGGSSRRAAQQRRSLVAVPCQSIFRAKFTPICRVMRPAPTAAAGSASWAKT